MKITQLYSQQATADTW